MIIVRVLLRQCIAAAKGVVSFLEQPKGSLMAMHPRFLQFMGSIPLWRMSLNMQDYGGETVKPTWLYCSDEFVGELTSYRRATPPSPSRREMVKKYVDADGRTRVAGGRDLKASQSCPCGFGYAIEMLLRRHAVRISENALLAQRARDLQADVQNLGMDPYAALPRSCDWLRGAGLEPVLLYMRREVRGNAP